MLRIEVNTYLEVVVVSFVVVLFVVVSIVVVVSELYIFAVG
jgi:hypothetical protein